MHKILVIEDEESLRGSIEDILTIEGFEAILAGDGERGIDLEKSRFPT